MSEENIETNVDAETPTTPTPATINDLKPKMRVKGTVQRLELYGAFIDLGVGVNALIHISQLGAERVNRVSDILNVGDEVTTWVDKVDPERQQIMVTMVEPLAVDWRDLETGQVYKGTISRLEDFGAFISIGAEREGLVHISELSHDFVKHPSEILTVGNEVSVQVLGFSRRKRRIDLSIKALLEKPEQEFTAPPEATTYERPRRERRATKPRQPRVQVYEFSDEDEGDMPTAMEIAMRKAMGDDLPPRGKNAGRKRRRRESTRVQQDDILNRTLHLQQES